MLEDIDRKILRILYNYSSGRRRLPSMEELVIKTGKTKKDITQCLINLEDQLFIIWENKKYVETIKIIQGWENGGTVKEERKPSTTNNTDYWTQY
ncbi:hypothetical protein P4H66_06120 [Paenibacillus dokdonensis]|uniref:LexA repressor DNA-binding domain-containing protein n=1 Tax=Paenibacillus dokdonensis TaxID=2567944 RepID=A0ABU6GI62_9BACL|nr:hypothetical protein [Paenibacillus dokdonensis]MEC0239430.1 hypothetical protein [Paenibacillus dokdonensis]